MRSSSCTQQLPPLLCRWQYFKFDLPYLSKKSFIWEYNLGILHSKNRTNGSVGQNHIIKRIIAMRWIVNCAISTYSSKICRICTIIHFILLVTMTNIDFILKWQLHDKTKTLFSLVLISVNNHHNFYSSKIGFSAVLCISKKMPGDNITFVQIMFETAFRLVLYWINVKSIHCINRRNIWWPQRWKIIFSGNLCSKVNCKRIKHHSKRGLPLLIIDFIFFFLFAVNLNV